MEHTAEPVQAIGAIPPLISAQGTEKQETPSAHGWLSRTLGAAAFRHRETFTSSKGHLFFGSIVNVVAGVWPTAAAFLGHRIAAKHYDAHAASHPDSLATKALSPFLSNEHPLGKQATFIFGGFATFRIFIKTWERSYNRLFGAAKTEQDAIQAISDLPKNIWHDIKDIAPREGIVNAFGSLILAGIPRKLLNKETFPVNKGQWEKATGGLANNMKASTAAYLVYFPFANLFYHLLGKGKDSPDYNQGLAQGVVKDVPAKFSQAARDIVEEAEEKVPSFLNAKNTGMVLKGSFILALTVLPFIASQRLSKAAFGMPDATHAETAKGFATNLAREYSGFVGFAASTFATAVLLHKLNKKHPTEQQDIASVPQH